VVFSLSVGSVVELLIGPYKGKMTGENSMFRTIHDQFSKGDWMIKEVYESLPDELTLRQVRVRVTQRGFRTKEVIVDTTLLDDIEITKSDLTNLYRQMVFPVIDAWI